jgi:hypothetical protein
MFRQIAASVGGVQNLIIEPSPIIAARLEAYWASRSRARLVSGLPIGGALASVGLGPRSTRVIWDHLIYAYLIENTRAAEIFRRVVYEVAHGERLAIMQNPLTYTWLRTTEDLFHSFGLPFLATSTVSQIRPDAGATRRNAYYRMFGMDLNHGGTTYEKAGDANRDFVVFFEMFLREVWRAIENAANSSGANPTDVAAIADTAIRLRDMLNERRGGTAVSPNLAREEFVAVAAMSWLHLIVDSNNAVINDLRATSASPEERLRRIGERVGIPSHAHSHSYFILAPLVSRLLIAMESGFLNTNAQVSTLFLPAPPTPNPRRDFMMTIIEQWSRATGRAIKASPVTATPTLGMLPPSAPRLPLPMATQAAVGAASTNGRTPANQETTAV